MGNWRLGRAEEKQDEDLEAVGLPFPEEPFVETALEGLSEEEPER